VVSVDTHLSASTKQADVVLAAAAYGEKAGTTTNFEGRVTTLGQKVTARGTSRPDWMIAAGVATALGADLGFRTVDDITDAIASLVESYQGVTREVLARTPDGVLSDPPASFGRLGAGSSDAPVRNAYDFRLVVSRTLYDAAVGTSHSPSLAHLAPGAAAHLHPLDIERAGVVAGADVKLISPKATVVLRAEPDTTVLRGTVWVPFNQPGSSVGELIDCTAAVTDVRIENL
jgi:NADH-quinone oxidoreductase subunit G